MKVKMLGFHVNFKSRYAEAIESRNEFFDYLIDLGDISCGQEHKMIISQNDSHYLGAFLTIRDQKSFCQIQRDKKSYTISTKKMDKNSNPVEFNFFVIEKSLLTGLYSHYHFSKGVNGFGHELKKLLHNFNYKKLNEEAKKTDAQTSTRDLQKKYSYRLDCETLIKDGDLASRVKASFSQIKKIDFSFSEIKPTEGDAVMSPLLTLAKIHHNKITFSENCITRAKDVVVGFLEKAKLRNATVEGIDESGLEQVFRLRNDYASYDEKDLDEMIDGLKIDSADLKKSIISCKVLQDMLEISNTVEKPLNTKYKK